MSRSSLPRKTGLRTLAVLTGTLALTVGGVSPALAAAEETEDPPTATASAAEEDPGEDGESEEDDSEEDGDSGNGNGNGNGGGNGGGDGDQDDDGDDVGVDPVAGVDEIVAAVEPGADVDALAADYGLTVVEGLTGSPDTFLLQAPSGADVTTLAAQVAADPRVRFAEPNFVTGAPEANPAYAWGQDGGPQPAGTDPAAWTGQQALSRIGAPQGQASGAGVTVAVLDTGISAGHPSLAGRLAGPGVDLIDGDGDPDDAANGVDDDGDGRVDEAAGHGTHVSGIVLAVAPDATILPVRVLDSDGRGSIFGLAEGIRTALESDADVLNISLGTTEGSELLAEVLEEASEDVVVVASAGNAGNRERQYPAATGGVVSVASVDPGDARSVFSNFGWVDVAAPGEDVVSTFPGGGYAGWAGTSMAAPFVAGQAAALLPLAGEDAAGRVPGLITSTAVPGDPGLGAGRIDVAASVAAAGTAGGTD